MNTPQMKSATVLIDMLESMDSTVTQMCGLLPLLAVLAINRELNEPSPIEARGILSLSAMVSRELDNSMVGFNNAYEAAVAQQVGGVAL